MIEEIKYIWGEKFAKVYFELIKVARNKQTIKYKEIANIMGIQEPGHHMAKETGRMLGEINAYEYLHNRPMLSAVAVTEDEGIPGKGFFECARDLGKLDDELLSELEQDEEKKRFFWKLELKMVYNTWCLR